MADVVHIIRNHRYQEATSLSPLNGLFMLNYICIIYGFLCSVCVPYHKCFMLKLANAFCCL